MTQIKGSSGCKERHMTPNQEEQRLGSSGCKRTHDSNQKGAAAVREHMTQIKREQLTVRERMTGNQENTAAVRENAHDSSGSSGCKRTHDSNQEGAAAVRERMTQIKREQRL
ncbi:hypothetical protein RRG08_042867 [Elysia crispata]|uniref:Uncharacterized protein n=1 Tax=Elysia crispata TaxID=231223 RepID=A0AAE1CWC9_9GAST|nr:hypothetical protein RRG08_042867 [Elysia crispata]